MTLDDIAGQERAVEILRGAYLADRLPHGLIFAGPPGIGKGTTAGALAGLFLCERPQGTRPCSACASCAAFNSGVHPDYHVITKELIRFHDKTGKSKAVSLSIDVIREELVVPANHKTAMGRGKVFVVEQAELMTVAAQNAMLKTLEEPAGRVLIVLLSDQPESMLPTIRSRCQTIRFATLNSELVRKQLEQRGIDPSLARDAADFSEGSIGIALRWIEDEVVGVAFQLGEKMDAMLAGGDTGDLSEFLKSAADAYGEKQLARDALASKDAAVRAGMGMYLALAGQRLRKAMKTTDDVATLDRACAAIDVLARAEMYLDANVNIPVVLQQLTMSLENPHTVSAT